MFTPKEVRTEVMRGDSVSVHYSKLSFALSGQGAFVNKQLLEEYARNQGENEFRNSVTPVGSGGISFILLADKIDQLGVSLSVFPTLGIDATIKVMEQHYLTYGYTVAGGHQVIFQKRLLYDSEWGISAGAFYDRIEQYLYNPCGGFCLGPNVMLINNTAGLRILILNHSGTKNRAFLSFNGKLGYVFETGSPYLNVGMSMGLF